MDEILAASGNSGQPVACSGRRRHQSKVIGQNNSGLPPAQRLLQSHRARREQVVVQFVGDVSYHVLSLYAVSNLIQRRNEHCGRALAGHDGQGTATYTALRKKSHMPMCWKTAQADVTPSA